MMKSVSWNTLELNKRIGTAWELLFLPELRIQDNAGELFYGTSTHAVGRKRPELARD